MGEWVVGEWVDGWVFENDCAFLRKYVKYVKFYMFVTPIT